MFTVIPNGVAYREFVLLRDGQGVLLRVAKPADVARVESFMSGLSAQSLYMRFMAGVSQVPRKLIEDLCTGDPRERSCLLAVAAEGAEERVIGLGNYIALGPNSAEVAFLVADAWQGKGISTLILERLAGIAAGYGFVAFEAEVLYDNEQMIRVFEGSGFETRKAHDGSVLHLEFPVDHPGAAQERADVRERIATANSLMPLLKPGVVAVVGASRDPEAAGSLILRNLLRSGYSGVVYPVNPKARAVQGLRAYASVTDLPEAPDLVVLSVPAPKVLGAAQRALQAGAKALLVITAGFAEAGAEGARRQEKLLHLVRSNGARLLGPNCLGLLNTDPKSSINASLAPALPQRGRIGFFSHSGALGLVILNYASERGLGFSTFVSGGNRADISGNDLLQYWEEDADTAIAMLYLETFGNPRRFARIARRVARKKPVLCVKGARSGTGRRVAQAHIGAQPLGEPEVAALFEQAGVIRANTLEEMFDTALLLAHQPLPAGRRVAILSNSGGMATLCADACEAGGLLVGDRAIRGMGPSGTLRECEKASEALLADPETDALIGLFACIGDCDAEPFARALRRGAVRAEKATGVVKPVLLSLMGASRVIFLPGTGRDAPPRAFPSYRFPERAAMALSRVARYAEFRRRPTGRSVWFSDTDPTAARRRVEALQSGHSAGASRPKWLSGEEAIPFLTDFGIPIAKPGDSEQDARLASLSVQCHGDFGAILRLGRRGKPSLLRILPLTDADIDDALASLGVQAPSGLGETLGRISQLVDALPWLCGLEAQALLLEGTATGPAPIDPSVRIAFRPAEYRPR